MKALWIGAIALNLVGAIRQANLFLTDGSAVNFVIGFLNCFAFVVCFYLLIED